MSGHNSRRSAWGRDKTAMEGRLWENKSFKMTAENARRNINKWSRIRAWRCRRAGWWWWTGLIRNTMSRRSLLHRTAEHTNEVVATVSAVWLLIETAETIGRVLKVAAVFPLHAGSSKHTRQRQKFYLVNPAWHCITTMHVTKSSVIIRTRTARLQ